MGCGASTPVKEDTKGKTTSAKKHQETRTQDSSQRGPTLNAGPHYKQIKHLGTYGVFCGLDKRGSVKLGFTGRRTNERES